MDSIKVIEAVLAASGLLLPEMILAPARGATSEEIEAEESLLRHRLNPDHARLLRRWNGLNLDVVRFYGCGHTEKGLTRLRDEQVYADMREVQTLVIGSDPDGFVYSQTVGGGIFSLDTDGGTSRYLAKDLDDLVCRLIFGRDAGSFAGEDWLAELKKAGLV